MTPDEARAAIRWRIPNKTPVRGQPIQLRVLAKCVVATGGCWEWQGHLDPNGYGRLRITTEVGGRWLGAHRLSWEAAFGPIADPDLCVCHHCDNTICCNPSHLFLGTRAENNADRHRKGRTVLPYMLKELRAA